MPKIPLVSIVNSYMMLQHSVFSITQHKRLAIVELRFMSITFISCHLLADPLYLLFHEKSFLNGVYQLMSRQCHHNLTLPCCKACVTLAIISGSHVPNSWIVCFVKPDTKDNLVFFSLPDPLQPPEGWRRRQRAGGGPGQVGSLGAPLLQGPGLADQRPAARSGQAQLRGQQEELCRQPGIEPISWGQLVVSWPLGWIRNSDMKIGRSPRLKLTVG